MESESPMAQPQVLRPFANSWVNGRASKESGASMSSPRSTMSGAVGPPLILTAEDKGLAARARDTQVGTPRDESGMQQPGLTKFFSSGRLRQEVIEEVRRDLDRMYFEFKQDLQDTVSQCGLELESRAAERDSKLSDFEVAMDMKINDLQSDILEQVGGIKESIETISNERAQDNFMVSAGLRQTSETSAELFSLKEEIANLFTELQNLAASEKMTLKEPNDEVWKKLQQLSRALSEQDTRVQAELEDLKSRIATFSQQVGSIPIQFHNNIPGHGNVDVCPNLHLETASLPQRGSQEARCKDGGTDEVIHEQIRCDIEDLNAQVHDLRSSIDADITNNELILVIQSRLQTLEQDTSMLKISRRIDDIFEMTQAMTQGTEKLALRLQSESEMWRSVRQENEERLTFLEEFINTSVAKNESSVANAAIPGIFTLDKVANGAIGSHVRASVQPDVKTELEDAVARLTASLQQPGHPRLAQADTRYADLSSAAVRERSPQVLKRGESCEIQPRSRYATSLPRVLSVPSPNTNDGNSNLMAPRHATIESDSLGSVVKMLETRASSQVNRKASLVAMGTSASNAPICSSPRQPERTTSAVRTGSPVVLQASPRPASIEKITGGQVPVIRQASARIY